MAACVRCGRSMTTPVHVCVDWARPMFWLPAGGRSDASQPAEEYGLAPCQEEPPRSLGSAYSCETTRTALGATDLGRSASSIEGSIVRGDRKQHKDAGEKPRGKEMGRQL